MSEPELLEEQRPEETLEVYWPPEESSLLDPMTRALSHKIRAWLSDPEALNRDIFQPLAGPKDSWEPPQLEMDAGQQEKLLSIMQELLQYTDNDSGNADKFLHIYKSVLRYCRRSGSWYVYDGKRWQEDSNGSERNRLAENMYHQLMAVFDFPGLPPAVSARKNSFSRLGNCTVRRNMLKAVEAKPFAFDQASMNQIKSLLVADNYIIDLKYGLPLLFNPSYYLTLKTELAYNLLAPLPKRFLKFMSEIFAEDEELISYVQKIFGYWLTGETREQCFFICYGSGCNGKSVLLNLFKRMLPEFVKPLAAGALDQRHDNSAPNPSLVQAKDARVVLLNETNREQFLDEARIKALSGEDFLKVRNLFTEDIEIRPHFKVVLTTNQFPRLNLADQALLRRIRIIPFKRVFQGEQIDPELADKLWQEREGILNWLVQGATRWYKEGLGEVPECAKLALEQQIITQDSFYGFFKEQVEKTGKKADKIQASVLYHHYLNWCEEQDVKEKDRLTMAAFGARIKKEHVSKTYFGPTRCLFYQEICLRGSKGLSERLNVNR